MYEIDDVFSSSSSVTSSSLYDYGPSLTLSGPNKWVLYIYIEYEINGQYIFDNVYELWTRQVNW